MELLKSNGQKAVERIFGTTFGMSNPDVAIVSEQIIQMLMENPRTGGADLRKPNDKLRQVPMSLANIKCAELFQEYSRSIGA